MQSLTAYSVLLGLILLGGWPLPAAACSCMPSGPPCEAFWGAAEVLDATVLEVVPPPVSARPPGPPFFIPETVVSLDVHRSYKTPMTGPLEITTGPTGGGCGYPFEPGRRYLIFAHWGAGGRLAATLCSATREFDGRGPAAQFLALLDASPHGGRVFGSVQTISIPITPDPPTRVPLTTTVTLSGEGGERATRSTGGNYEFAGLPPGTYQLEAQVPEGYGPAPATRSVQVADPRGCAVADFTFAPAGRIAGRLIDHDSRPIASVRVEVAPADAPPHPGYGVRVMQGRHTTADGSFVFDMLPPGRYIVGVNLDDLPSRYNPYARSPYPGSGMDPYTIDLAQGQAVDLGSWHLPPPLVEVHLAGIVVRRDGTPAPNVFVSALDITRRAVARARAAGAATSDAHGRFVLELRHGRVYTFIARGQKGVLLRSSGPRIDTGAGELPLVRIVVLD